MTGAFLPRHFALLNTMWNKDTVLEKKVVASTLPATALFGFKCLITSGPVIGSYCEHGTKIQKKCGTILFSHCMIMRLPL